MSARDFVWFREIARYARSIAALGFVFLTVRFAWLSGAEAMAELRQEAALPSDDTAAPSPSRTRADPKVVADEFRDAPQAAVGRPEAASDKPRLRRLLVDLGPERSEVFVQGASVGRSPYVGQISCVDGDRIVIDVLPPHGAPLQRTLTCRSSHLAVTR